MSVKRIARIRRDRHVIRYFSKKAGCALVLETFLELWMACKLEADIKVKTFASQPESLNLKIDGKSVRYTPDFLVIFNDGTAKYIEIHHEAFTTEAYKKKVAAFDQYTRQSLGVSIELITRNGLNEIELVNFMLLTRHRSLECSINLDDIDCPRRLTIDKFIIFLEAYSLNPIADIYHLMASGVYQFDGTELITRDSKLWRSIIL